MSRVWRLRSNGSALYSRGMADIPYFTPDPASVALSRLVGKAFYTTLPDPPDPETGDKFTDAAPAWLPTGGETILSNRSTLATLVQATEYTTSRDVGVVLRAVEAQPNLHPGPVHVQFGDGKWYMNRMYNTQTASTNGNWVGFNNNTISGQRRVLGMCGTNIGVDGSGNPKLLTEFVVSPTMLYDTPSSENTSAGVSLYNYALNPPITAPVPIVAFYFSNTSSNAPLFFSGIHFMGQLQTPFGVYGANAQTKFKRLQGTAAPLPWNGFSIWRAQAGSRFQHCKFTGYGFTLNSAPPFETCAIGTNYCNIRAYKIEIDGRTSAEYDAGRRRASGGYMVNKPVEEWVTDLKIHWPRRSGFALNTNTHDLNEKLHVINNEFLRISDFGPEDLWPSDVEADFNPVAGFNAYNIEGWMGQYWIENAHQNSAHGHASFATGAAGTGYDTPTTRPVLFIKNARSDDTIFNKMFRISVQGTTTFMHQRLTADFNLYTNIWFDVRRADNVRLAPVKASVYNQNPSLYGPNTHYLMRSF